MYVYEIRLQGHLDQHWSTWFDGLAISYTNDGSTLLRGPLPDEAALHGVLIKVRDLALPLLALSREEPLTPPYQTLSEQKTPTQEKE